MKFKSLIFITAAAAVIILAAACASTKVRIIELENKGTGMNVSAPDWIKIYVEHGVSRVQSRSEFRDTYVVIGEETGVNKQFVLAWADNFSAQQRIGNMLRTTIVSEYQARVRGQAQSIGGGTPSAAGETTGVYQQEIDSVINAIVNVSYSGAQRHSDWWSLRRRYDPDVKDAYSDEYTAYVLYTIPKSELNQQVARALETSVKSDSALYDVTIEMAKNIFQNGMSDWGGEEK